MRIYQFINKVPGGLMVVPLFIGMLINTFCPNALKIGGFTQALTNQGYPTVLAMYLFTVGTKMTLRAAPGMLKRGFGILLSKVGIAVLIALAISHFFHGNFLGLSTLAVLAAMNDTNGGMFLALTSTFGSKEDSGTYVAQSIETGRPIVARFGACKVLGLQTLHQRRRVSEVSETRKRGRQVI